MSSRKTIVVNDEPTTHHLYFDSPFSPESFSIYNINEKHALDVTLNASRVNHFIAKLATNYSFLPRSVPQRMERILGTLHYGWCSHAMDLLKGDLNLIKAERAKKVPNDFLIADIGMGIEKLLDTFEIAIRLDELSAKPLAHAAKLRGNEEEHELYTLGEKFRCFSTVLVHPETGLQMAPKQNGCGGKEGGATSSSVFHHVLSPSEDSATWQLFFDVLVQQLEAAAFLIQENIETDNGYIQCSHLPDLYRVIYYITHDEGRHLYTALRNKSILYQQDGYTCSPCSPATDAATTEASKQEDEEDDEEESEEDNKVEEGNEKREVDDVVQQGGVITTAQEGYVSNHNDALRRKVLLHRDATAVPVPEVDMADVDNDNIYEDEKGDKDLEKQNEGGEGDADEESDKFSISYLANAKAKAKVNSNYVPYSRPIPVAQSITIDLSSFERRPHTTADVAYLDMLTQRCHEWIAHLTQIISMEVPYTRISVLEFIDILKQMPIPIQYVTLHYLVADGLFFNILPCDRSDYFDWIIQAFVATRFFVGLATVSSSDFKDMMCMMIRHTSTPLPEGEEKGEDYIETVGAKMVMQEKELGGDVQIPASIIEAIPSRITGPGGVPLPSFITPSGSTSTDSSSSTERERGERWRGTESGLMHHWTDFASARERMRCGLKTELLTGIWSAFKWQFRYHHLSAGVLRWRWCTHVQRPGRFNSSRYKQIDRELAYLVSCGPSATFDGAAAGSVVSGGDGGIDDVVLTIKHSTPSSASSSKSKKKKKKPNPDNIPQKPTLLTPNDNPLLLLQTEFSPEAFIPKKFAVSGGGKGLSQELERLRQSAQKQCGDPYIATDIFKKLDFFPVEIRYLFLMHLIKNPFPDHPYSLLNLWKVIPMPSQKEDRGNFILILLDLITALASLNDVWKGVIYQPTGEENDKKTTHCSKEKKREKVSETKRNNNKNANMKESDHNRKNRNKPGFHATNKAPLRFYLPSTSPVVVPYPRLLIANLHQYKDLVPDKIRLENGLSWGRGEVTAPQQQWIQGWWNVAHSFITGCRTVMMLADSCVLSSSGSGSLGAGTEPSFLSASVTASSVSSSSSLSSSSSGAANSTAAYTHTTTLKCLLEQLRAFSNSSSSNSGSGDDSNGEKDLILHSKALSTCASYGSHVLLQRSTTTTVYTTTADDSGSDSDSESVTEQEYVGSSSDSRDHGEQEEQEEEGSGRVRVFQVRSNVLPCCSSLTYAMDCELAEVFEDLCWGEADDSAKLHCVEIFADFLYRNWTTAPAVLDFLENNELQALPLVLQFSLLQQLSFATSRVQQECLIHVMRYAYCCSGLRDVEKDPYSNAVKYTSVAAANMANANSMGTATSRSVSVAESTLTYTTNPSSGGGCGAGSGASSDGFSLFGESSLLSMLGEEPESFSTTPSLEATACETGGAECRLKPQEQERVAALTYECFLMVKIRYQELISFNRWKFGHPEAVATATLDGLKEEMEKVISSVNTLTEDLRNGSMKCFEVADDDLDREGGGFDVYDEDDEDDEEEEGTSVFDTAYQELFDYAQRRAELSGQEQTQKEEQVGGHGNPDIDNFSSSKESRHPRVVKRFNTRTVMWLSSYTHSNHATSHMLDRMWTTALK